MEDVKIISTNTISRLTDEAQEPVEIGKKLNVDAVIEGTLQRADGKLRVTLRLIRIADSKQIWTGVFDDSENKIFNLQDEIARRTAQILSLSLKSIKNEKLLTTNIEAYEAYLQGQYLFRRREQKSVEFFKKAVALDPQFARAWAGLAATYAFGRSMAEAETTVNKALELEPDLAEAHAVRGFIKLFLDWNWAEAERSLDRAIQLDSNLVEAHHWQRNSSGDSRAF